MENKKDKILYILCIWILILFVVIWYDSNLLTAFEFVLFVLSTSIFIFNVIYSYQRLIKNRFNLSEIKKEYSWWAYFIVSTFFVILLSFTFLSDLLLEAGIIVSTILLIILFLYDVFKNRLFK